MHLTMSSAIKKIKSVKEIDVATISKAASDGALMGEVVPEYFSTEK